MPRLAARSVRGLLLLICIAAVIGINTLYARGAKAASKVVPPYLGPYEARTGEVSHGFLPSDIAADFCRRRRLEVYRTRNRRRKVYDLLLLNTELEWLELRLEELYDKVDFFVVLEASSTFQETHKPLHLLDNWARFAKYHPKLIRRTLSFAGARLPANDTWEHERFARNALFDQALRSLADDPQQRPQQGDVLVVSDVDELPRPEVLDALRNCAFPPRVTLRSAFYYYSFQWLHRGEQWPHPQATFFNGDEATVRPEALRTGAPDLELHSAAWHCSTCLPTLADVVNKIASFSHKGYNHLYYLDRARLLHKIRSGVDMFERESEVFDRIDANMDIPRTLLADEGRDKYRYMLDRDPPNANFRDINGRE